MDPTAAQGRRRLFVVVLHHRSLDVSKSLEREVAVVMGDSGGRGQV
jgi:hypothetical protein